MKALVWEGPELLRIRDVKEPHTQPGWAVMRVDAVGLCGSELGAYLGHNELRVPPLVMGHEWAGVVEAVDDPDDADWVGQTVTANPLVTCGRCRACLRGHRNLCATRQIIGIDFPGAFAERLAVPVTALLPVRDTRLGALVEPLACAVRVVAQGHVRPGDRVLVFGAGIIGLMSAWMARRSGAMAVAVTDPNPVRLQHARRWGADVLVEADQGTLRERLATDWDDAPDVAIDAVGTAETRAAAAAIVSRGGRVVLVGLHEATSPFPANRLVRDEVTLSGSFCYSDDNFRVARDLVNEGALPDTAGWLDVRPLDAGDAAFQEQTRGAAPFAKILFHPVVVPQGRPT